MSNSNKALASRAGRPIESSIDLQKPSAEINLLSQEELFKVAFSLYKGNGWIISEFKRGWDKYLALSYPKQPSNFVLFVKPIASEHPLSYSEVKEELKKLEAIGREIGCEQFALLCPAGYEPKAEKLSEFNLLLEDAEAIKRLSNRFSSSRHKEPDIQLFAHNKRTYKNICERFKTSKKVAVVQATGTGKSFLIAKVLSDFSNKNRIVLAPSHYILDQLKAVIPWEASSIAFMTYSKLMYLSEAEISSFKPDLVILDEFHRCGAEEWGKGVQFILDTYPNTCVLGTSATPIRHLDNCRDMAEELFNGNVAENLSLAQAIVKRILPMPKYVCALYTLEEESKLLKERIGKSERKDSVKSALHDQIDAFSIDWERTKGIPYVLKKHIKNSMRSFVVFCREEASLDETESMVKDWFKMAGISKKIEIYRVTHNEKESYKNLERFKESSKADTIKLLFSINMLNEGLHVDDVHGVILLRPTESPNIFYQQIGRCLKVGLNQTPVIFDFVNNFRNIRAHDFLRELDHFKQQEGWSRAESGLDGDLIPDFHIIDEVREITEVFGQIEFKLDNWDEMYEELVQYKEKCGNCNVPGKWKENLKLANWVFTQRQRKASLSSERIEALDAIGFVWDVNDFLWERRFKELKEYKARFGHTMLLSEYRNEFNLLYGWMGNQRMFYAKQRMAEERIQKLTAIGFDFRPSLKSEEKWEDYFLRLTKFKEQFGHCNVTRSYRADKPLADWCDRLRNVYKGRMRGNLSPERIKKLDDLGFQWDSNSKEAGWNKRYSELVEFKKKYGHTDVSKSGEYKNLGDWVSAQRNYYVKGILRADRLEKLKAIGFNWKVKGGEWERMLEEYKNYKAKSGRLRVPATYPENQKLADWYYMQKNFMQNGLLSEDREKTLRAIGLKFEFRPDFIERGWKLNFEKLLKFKKENGHTNVPQKYKDKELALWVTHVRVWYKNKKLTQEKVNALNEIDFVWFRYDQLWQRGFENVKEAIKTHGNIEFTQNKFRELYSWIRDQRLKFKQGKLSSEKIELLNSINFKWEAEVRDEWQIQYNSLLQYKAKHGHCNVPANSKEYPELSNWVRKIRRMYSLNFLEANKVVALEELGFNWQRNHKWLYKFEQASSYFASSTQPDLKELPSEISKWVMAQKVYYRKGKLNEEQIGNLKNIGLI